MSDLGIEHTSAAECINIHSDKDISVYAVHDRTTDILNDDTDTVTNNKSVTVKSGKSEFKVNAGTHTEEVNGAVTETFKDTQNTTVTKEIVITSATAHIYIHGCTNIQLHVGASKLWMASDGNISLEGVNVTVMGSASVTIKGGVVHSEADSEHQTKGAIVLSEGSATNTVKGGMVMLNP
jgi:type VI secretion system secreted protein VgrG